MHIEPHPRLQSGAAKLGIETGTGIGWRGWPVGHHVGVGEYGAREMTGLTKAGGCQAVGFEVGYPVGRGVEGSVGATLTGGATGARVGVVLGAIVANVGALVS